MITSVPCAFLSVVTGLLITTIFVLGAAYVFYSSTGTSGWCQASKLVASDGVSYAYFGFSVYTTGNLVAVGAYSADTLVGALNTGKRKNHVVYDVN